MNYLNANQSGGTRMITPTTNTPEGIQSAIDHIENSSNKGGIVFLPAGKYTIQNGGNNGEVQEHESGSARRNIARSMVRDGIHI